MGSDDIKLKIFGEKEMIEHGQTVCNCSLRGAAYQRFTQPCTEVGVRSNWEKLKVTQGNTLSLGRYPPKIRDSASLGFIAVGGPGPSPSRSLIEAVIYL